jgi:hypothetical protein
VPAAAVIPAPLAYIKVVAVKKLVVGSVYRTAGSPLAALYWSVRTSCRWASRASGAPVVPSGLLLTGWLGGPARLL